MVGTTSMNEGSKVDRPPYRAPTVGKHKADGVLRGGLFRRCRIFKGARRSWYLVSEKPEPKAGRVGLTMLAACPNRSGAPIVARPSFRTPRAAVVGTFAQA